MIIKPSVCCGRSVSDNALTVFDTDELTGLHSLLSVDLTNNQIFHLGTLPNITDLQSVDVSSNNVQSVGIHAISTVADSGNFITL